MQNFFLEDAFFSISPELVKNLKASRKQAAETKKTKKCR